MCMSFFFVFSTGLLGFRSLRSGTVLMAVMVAVAVTFAFAVMLALALAVVVAAVLYAVAVLRTEGVVLRPERLVENEHFGYLTGREVLAEFGIVFLLQAGEVLEAFEALFCQFVEVRVGQFLAGFHLGGSVLLEEFIEFRRIFAVGGSELLRLLVTEHEFVGETLDVELDTLLLCQLFVFATLALGFLRTYISHQDGTNSQNH